MPGSCDGHQKAHCSATAGAQRVLDTGAADFAERTAALAREALSQGSFSAVSCVGVGSGSARWTEEELRRLELGVVGAFARGCHDAGIAQFCLLSAAGGSARSRSRILAIARNCTGVGDTRMEAKLMKISARNVLPGTVSLVTKGAVNGEIVLSLGGGENFIAIITNSSVDRLGLRPGIEAFAIIKASDVMVGKGLENAKLSARNILAGKIAELNEGTVNSEVGIQLHGGTMLIASITKESVQALNLKEGDAISAVVKASHVMIGV